MASSSDPLNTLEQQNGGGHQCIASPPASDLAASIQEKLDGVRPVYSECCIYRVPRRLRRINQEAYTPNFVSIGPFHHGKENLKVQETLKWQYLISFVGRNSGVTLSEYVKTIKEIEEGARKCYAQVISANSDEFVTMMLVDGCFILEFFYSVVGQVPGTNPWYLDAIRRDLILLENQLPFFVLEVLYKLNIGNELATLTPIFRIFSFIFAGGMLTAEDLERALNKVLVEKRDWSKVKELVDFVLEGSSSSHALPGDNNNEEADSAVVLRTSSVQTSSVAVDIGEETSHERHLLDFVRDCFIPSSKNTGNGNSPAQAQTDDASSSGELNCTSVYPWKWKWNCFIPSSLANNTGNGNSEERERPGQAQTDDASSRVLNCTSLYPWKWKWNCFIPSSGNKELQLPHNVTALHKKGVKFEVGGTDKCLLDISFNNGVLAIPCINIHDPTDSLLRNMIAFEQLHCVGSDYSRSITDYATLLDTLIDTSKDVELLRDKGIIKNSLGDHEEVSLLFNKLVKEVIVDEDKKFYYYRLCHDLNAYQRFWHAWVADLSQTYFKTPWTAISVIAAAVLIVLTILQTIYTIKSYTKE